MKISFSLIFLLLFFSCTSKQESRIPTSTRIDSDHFTIGFNQGWIHNRYNWQFTKRGFDANEFRRVFRLNKRANGSLVRIWLFPGHDPLFLSVRSAAEPNYYRIASQSKTYLSYVKKMLDIASEEGIKLNLVLFNGVSSHEEIKKEFHKYFWNDFINDKNNLLDNFLTGTLEDVLDLINSKQAYREIVTQMDIANEVNAFTTSAKRRNGIGFENGVKGANRFICKVYEKIKEHPVGRSLQVTASLGFDTEKFDLIYNRFPWPACVDFFDVHVYDNEGRIKGCKSMVRYAKKHNKLIQLGEFGQYQDPVRIDNEMQNTLTENFLINAKECGLSGALAWRLSESKGSERYLYNTGTSKDKNSILLTDEKGNRPAYYIFKETAQKILDNQINLKK